MLAPFGGCELLVADEIELAKTNWPKRTITKLTLILYDPPSVTSNWKRACCGMMNGNREDHQ
jgi:hypothetical protein